jgi:hypothetical protein
MVMMSHDGVVLVVSPKPIRGPLLCLKISAFFGSKTLRLSCRENSTFHLTKFGGVTLALFTLKQELAAQGHPVFRTAVPVLG